MPASSAPKTSEELREIEVLKGEIKNLEVFLETLYEFTQKYDTIRKILSMPSMVIYKDIYYELITKGFSNAVSLYEEVSKDQKGKMETLKGLESLKNKWRYDKYGNCIDENGKRITAKRSH